MSHIVTINTEIRDPTALMSACRRQELAPPQFGTHRLFQTNVEGWAVNLPDWRFPVVCQTDVGRVQFDNFQGRWGDVAYLDRLLQNYAVEKAVSEARRQGYGVTEQPLSDGSIRLSIAVGGLG